MIATNCVNNDTLYPSYNTNRYISEETYQTWFRGHPLPGDILFVCKGSPGRTNWVPDPVDFCIAQDMVSVRPDPTKIYPKYLFAVLRSEVIQSQINNMHVGTMIPHFKKGDFDKLKIPVPSIGAQIFIGDYYFAISERITLLRGTNSTLEAIAQTIFKSWFIDFDPVRAKAEGRAPEGIDAETAALFPDSFEESELGLVPKGWSITTLNTAYEINPTRKLKKDELAPYLDMANVPTNGHHPDIIINRKMGSGSKFMNGDTLLARITPCLENGKTAFVDFLLDNQIGWGSTEFLVLRPKSPLPLYHGYLLSRHAPCMSGTSGRQRIQNDVLGRYPVVIPTTKINGVFNAIVTRIQEKITSNSEQIHTLAELRDTLLPRLISGHLQLPDELIKEFAK